MASLGVARYDIEVAHYRGFELTWVVKKAYERLERPDTDIQAEIHEHKIAKPFTPADYRVVLVKNLKLIECLNLASVDWQRVERSLPGARAVELDLDADGTDMSFRKWVVPFLT